MHNDRVDNGGALTNQERNQVNHEQNGASRQIYNENHNDNTQHGTPPAPRSTPPPPPHHNNPPPAPKGGANDGGGQHDKH